MNYIEFIKELEGYNYFKKNTNTQIYRFEMFWSGLTPYQCKEKFKRVERDNTPVN